MGNKMRVYNCEQCGRATRRLRHNYEPMVCADCGVSAAVAAARAMVARTGPAWEAHQRNPGGRPRKAPPPTE